ncbi:MAG: cupin domain-containing protein [Dyadobacter sp.]|uniref:cupin domain-containing protein n=1 Tax=Dyadobacter sp. TaxID=1914288 RepID=UPI0032648AB2
MQRRTFLLDATAIASCMVTQVEAGNLSTADKHFVVKAGDARFGVHPPYRGVNANDVKISGKDTNGQLAVFEYIGKEMIGPALHVHHDQDEIFSIIDGEYLFQVGNEKFTVKAGDTVFAPRGIPHTWIQLSAQGIQVYMVQPAGQLEDFFLALNELKEAPTEESIKRMHESYGMSVLGPPLSLR